MGSGGRTPSACHTGELSAATNLAGIVVEGAGAKLVLNETVIAAVTPKQLLGGTVGIRFVLPFVDGNLKTTLASGMSMEHH